MKFDKWFEKQSLLIKVILLIIPFVGWVVEVLVRISAFIRKNSTVNLVGMIIAIIGNWIWSVIDLVVLIVTGKLFLLE
jgi:hypothetical protein